MLKRYAKKCSGFTLIEIIFVVLVVGVLASLALGNYGPLIDRARVAEAKTVLLHGYAGYQRLVLDNEVISGGNPLSWSRMGMQGVDTMANRYFDYTIRPNANAPTSLRATLIRNNTKYAEVSLPNGNLTLVNF